MAGRGESPWREGPVLREKELRIALVCFGGVSLAVYMHGITYEILKLVRASSALHRISDRTRRGQASFFDEIGHTDPEYDTEGVYFELLRDIGRSLAGDGAPEDLFRTQLGVQQVHPATGFQKSFGELGDVTARSSAGCLGDHQDFRRCFAPVVEFRTRGPDDRDFHAWHLHQR